jgi:nucleoside-diphosphate-sugar epimerase
VKSIKEVLVTGGAGYVGAALIPKLLAQGYGVRVLDLYMFDEHVFDSLLGNSRLCQIKGDIRDQYYNVKKVQEVGLN